MGNQVLCAEISCKPGLVLLVMLIVITDSATYRIHLEQQVLNIFSAVLKANRRGQCFSTSHSDTNNQQKQGSRAEGTPAKSVNTQTHMWVLLSGVCVKSPPWRCCSLHPVTPLPTLFNPRKWHAEDRNSLCARTHTHKLTKMNGLHNCPSLPVMTSPPPTRCLLGLFFFFKRMTRSPILCNNLLWALLQSWLLALH